MWLKTYLNFGPDRQPWAAVTDIIINAAAPNITIAQARKNPFLQCWNTPIRGQHAEKLNDDIRRMLNVARVHCTNLAAIKVSTRLRHKLLAWYHIDEKLAAITSRTGKCLINNHKVSTVTDLVKVSTRIRDQNQPDNHRPTPFCNCEDCTGDSTSGCYNPHECATEALQRVWKISPKWNPLGQLPPDPLSLTPSRKARNQLARYNNGAITFDPSVTCKDNLVNAFQVFIDLRLLSNLPALRRPTAGRNLDSQKITTYTDGACINNGKRNATCRSGIWVEHGSPLNKAFWVPGADQSNQVGEIAAIILAVTSVLLSQPLEIISNSKYAIEGLTTHLQSWEDQGWIGIKNTQFFRRAAFLLCQRTAPTTFKWVKGHKGVEGNEMSDRLAQEGATRPTLDILDLSVPDTFNV